MRELWTRLERWFSQNGIDARLRPGASAADLSRLEQVIGRPLPQDFAESWSIHDGQEQHAEMAWLPSGGRLGSIECIIEEYQRNYANEPVDPETFEWLTVPDLVRGQLSHPGRLPISGSDYTEGNNMYLDFIPGPRGTEGQVITLVSECDFAWLGASFRGFLSRYVELCERGELIWVPSQQRVDWAHRKDFWDPWEHLFT